MTFRIKQGDLEPAPIIPLLDGDIPADLTGADIVVRGFRQRGGSLFIDTLPTVDAVNGLVTHVWKPGETDQPGRIYMEVVATWPGGRPETYPPNGYLVVDVEESL